VLFFIWADIKENYFVINIIPYTMAKGWGFWIDYIVAFGRGIELQGIIGCNQFDLLDDNIGLFISGCSSIFGKLC
jgi:hypothetical protein